uniref:Uncharacterized protein n=1 Tax=Setaria digitata TaxID=48799 RepID=A0A915Q6V5_9BILA
MMYHDNHPFARNRTAHSTLKLNHTWRYCSVSPVVGRLSQATLKSTTKFQILLDGSYSNPCDRFLRCSNSTDQNPGGRVKYNPSSNCNYAETNDDINRTRKIKVSREFYLGSEQIEMHAAVDPVIRREEQCNRSSREIGTKLIALADTFDAIFFGNSRKPVDTLEQKYGNERN